MISGGSPHTIAYTDTLFNSWMPRNFQILISDRFGVQRMTSTTAADTKISMYVVLFSLETLCEQDS